MMDPTRVVLDCATANEVDDQFAIANALGAPNGAFEVRGVVSVHNTTAHGAGSRDMYQDEAEWVVALCGSDAPCVPGAERPMESREELVPSAGLEFLVGEARQGSKRGLRPRRATGPVGPHGGPKKSPDLIDNPRSRDWMNAIRTAAAAVSGGPS